MNREQFVRNEVFLMLARLKKYGLRIEKIADKAEKIANLINNIF